MTTQSRSISVLLVLSFVLLLVAGCGRAYTAIEPTVAIATEATVVSTVQYLDGLSEGPLYQVTVTLPESLVGKIATRNIGNIIYFDYVEGNAPLFSIQALSRAQFWKQGAYPGEFTNVTNTKDTYFVHYQPIDAYYSGLPKDTFATLSAEVPGILKTLAVVAAPAPTAAQ